MFSNLFGGGNRGHSLEEISVQQLAEKRQRNEQVIIVDVREPYEYKEGHISGSKLIPLGQLTQHLNELGDKDQEIIMVCRSGSRSSSASRQLAGLGYKKILNLQGGMMSWQRSGLRVER